MPTRKHCLMATIFGFIIGLLLSGVSIIIPILLVITIAAVLYVQRIRAARRAVALLPVVYRPAYTRTSSHVSSTKAKKFFADVVDWVIIWSKKTIDYLKPKLEAIGARINHNFTLFSDKVKQSPVFWAGVVMSMLALYQFIDAYRSKNIGTFHAGLLSSTAAVILFIYHYDQVDTVTKKVIEYWKAIWHGLSVGAFFLIVGHGWGFIPAVASIVSAIAATITLCGGWPRTGKAVEELSSTGIRKFLNFWKGEFGMTKLLLALCLATLALIYFFFFGGNHLVDDQEAWARLISLVFVILLLLVMVVGIYKIHKNMK